MFFLKIQVLLNEKLKKLKLITFQRFVPFVKNFIFIFLILRSNKVFTVLRFYVYNLIKSKNEF